MLDLLSKPTVNCSSICVDPLLSGFIISHLVNRDRFRYGVLVIVCPGEVLKQARGRRTGVHELLACDLVKNVRRIIARNSLRVSITTRGVRRKSYVL